MNRFRFLPALKIAVLLLLTLVSSPAEVKTYKINFSNGDAVPTGFTNYKPQNFHKLEEEVVLLDQNLKIVFDAVDNYTMPDTTNPLVAGGIFVNPKAPSNFTISGLPAASSVSLYAIDAWDEHGRAALIDFGGRQTDTALTRNDGHAGGMPGLNPDPEKDMALVGDNVPVDSTGILKGVISCHEERPEGQVGGFVLIVRTGADAKKPLTPAPTTTPAK